MQNKGHRAAVGPKSGVVLQEGTDGEPQTHEISDTENIMVQDQLSVLAGQTERQGAGFSYGTGSISDSLDRHSDQSVGHITHPTTNRFEKYTCCEY